MASLDHTPLPGGEKASGIEGLQTTAHKGSASARWRDALEDRRPRQGRARVWMVDILLLVAIAGLVVGGIFLYRYLRDTYAPSWDEEQVVYVLELPGVDPALLSSASSGDRVLVGKEIYASAREDADVLGTVQEVVRISDGEASDSVTLYVTVTATVRYREGKGYWIGDTRLLCGKTYSIRVAGLETEGELLSLRTQDELNAGSRVFA